ncbi:LOW QUALITY PROTEIN: DNA-directed RNA polymerase III subunit 2 isoform X1 [Populus alba x Populus x berolinensis]|uniref:DNA-directed RNA polymerase subunit beta n=1 Tax=Populus alba x Populus x berolinensis TaxID=444605 RepID=A0AAD6PVW3_9ROSI|nr:LOW QUALITY PROTEIN: DNA-directed RNA polymerase III subunit 2 isoform X1 [Populus alba x Populus x berolinensis]
MVVVQADSLSEGLVKQHLDSFNYFINIGIKKIVRANDRIVSTVDPSLYLRFTDVKIGKPSMVVDAISEQITPHMCRLSDTTYAAPILVNIEYISGSHGRKEKMIKNDVVIGRMPIMLRSCCCVLYGKNEAELARLGECPLDPGGYFVVKGTEKVILIQEQLSKNRIIIDNDKKGNINASVTSSTEATKSKTVILMEKEKMYLCLNQFAKKIPIMVVMKAMGMESDQEVVQMVGRDPRYSMLLLPSIEECASHGVYTQQQALEYLEAMVKRSTYSSSSTEKQENRALAILRDVFIANVPVRKNNFRPKCIYVAVMLRRMMEALLNKDAMDDKDYVGNKRLELSGQLISLLFEDLFKTMITEVQKTADTLLVKQNRSSRFDFSQYIVRDSITNGLERALSTGNWDVKRFRMNRKGVTQVLVRLSYMASLGHMTRISPQFEKSRKVSGPRALQPSQWGMLCPCDTPEGEACGLVKNLALMTHVTTDEEESPLISLCKCLGVEDLELLSGEELHTPNSFLVIFNGLILGKHRRPQQFANAMRKLRRAGKIGEFVSVFVNEKQHAVYIASDGGRVCRPLVIADKGVSRIKEHHMRELMDGARTFDDFLHEGLIEYLDVNEENNALIALYEWEATPETTHIEIEPFTILGVVAGLIPYPHHNQSPRNTYQLGRMDSLLYLLVYPQRPLLTTRTIELVGYDKLGAGQNATVAVMSYSGYDIEDAIVMNKASLDRGFGRCIVLKKYTCTNQKYENGASDRILRPRKNEERERVLDDDGLAAPGEIIRHGDIYINKESPIETRGPLKSAAALADVKYRPCAQIFKGTEGESCVVDRVALCSDKNNNLCIKYKIRHTRRPEVGDKFSSRHGQKGVCGTIIQQEDFPFSERGICPDLIMNPHGFPSRMTVGKMIELLGGKAGVSCGRFHYGSAFGEPMKHLLSMALATMERTSFIQSYIFMGPIYYQKLKHMVLDKIHARGSGPRVMLTRQPTDGRARNGGFLFQCQDTFINLCFIRFRLQINVCFPGLRVGEMEKDCLVAYGTSMLLYERLMVSSDQFEAQVCRACGLLGYYNQKLKAAMCTTCKNGDKVSTMKLPYACKLLIQHDLMANLTVTSNVKLKRWIKLMNFVVQRLLPSSLDKRSVNANMSSHIILASSDSGAVGRFLHKSMDDANDLPVLRISGALKSVKYWAGKLPFLIPYPMESQIPTASLDEMSELLDNGCARTLVCDNTIYEMGTKVKYSHLLGVKNGICLLSPHGHF